MKHLVLGLAMVCALVLSYATIQANESQDHVCFRIVDADENGEVNYAEYKAYFGDDREGFDAADQNGDEALSHDEYHMRLGHGSASS